MNVGAWNSVIGVMADGKLGSDEGTVLLGSGVLWLKRFGWISRQLCSSFLLLDGVSDLTVFKNSSSCGCLNVACTGVTRRVQ